MLPNLHGWPRVPHYIHNAEQHLGRRFFRNYGPSIALWGGFAGVAVLYFMEPIPLVRRDIFSKLPVVGSYWAKMLPAEEPKDDE